MEYVFIQRQGDKEAVKELIDSFKKLSKIDLIKEYNSEVKIGIVGSHAQAQRIVALNIVFMSIFRKSPIKVEQNLIISLTGMIGLKNHDWYYLNF